MFTHKLESTCGL